MLVRVAAGPNTSHSYLVFAETAIKAIHKLNYQIRMRIKLRNVDVQYEKEWIHALRRYKRKYKPKWGGVHSEAVKVYALTPEFVYGLSYFEITLLNRGHENILPILPLDAGPQETALVE